MHEHFQNLPPSEAPSAVNVGTIVLVTFTVTLVAVAVVDVMTHKTDIKR